MTDRDTILLKAANALSDLGVALRELVKVSDIERTTGDRLLTMRQACEYLAIGRTKLKGLIRDKHLLTTRIGKRPRVKMSSIHAYEQRRMSA